MAFGRRKTKDQPVDEPESRGSRRKPDVPDETPAIDDLAGPFDVEDFDDPAAAAEGRLDLGAVLVPLPEAAQLQVELTEVGVPSAVWVVTPNGRFTIAAYAAPKTGGLWREVAAELAESLRNDGAEVTIQDGRWGREVVGTGSGVVRFIGVDGYRWMIRCVVNGSIESRGDTPLPVRTPLPVELPEPMASQLRDAAAAQGAPTGEQPVEQPDAVSEDVQQERRSASGSAMQQLRGDG
jgi:hypothetical protein